MGTLARGIAVSAAGATGGFLAGRAWGSSPAGFARMSGSSVAAPDAAGWITDFLNAAYYRRHPDVRDVEDLRLAFVLLTTSWHRHKHRRLRAHDVMAYHRAFGRERFVDVSRSPRGCLEREALLEGAARLHGDWFPAAYADATRRGWGIAFETAAEKAAYRPEVRLRHARLGGLTPPVALGREQTWHTYPAVEVPSAEGVIAALSATETWPDYATELGRFTPVRTSGLAGQTFEIEVAAGTESGRPIFVRGYVTITRVVSTAGSEDLEAYISELEDGLVRFGRDEPPAVPPGATPILAFDLTTHEGHFMGAGRNRLVLYEHDGRAWVRAAGTWDPMSWHLDQAYRRAGRDAQHAFWGQGRTEAESLLHQIASRVAAAVPA